MDIHEMADIIVRSKYCRCGTCQQAAEDLEEYHDDGPALKRLSILNETPSQLEIRHSKRWKRRHRFDEEPWEPDEPDQKD